MSLGWQSVVALYGVCDACSSAYRSADDLTVGVLLPPDFQVGVERGGAQPEVGVVLGAGIGVHGNAFDVFQQLFVERLHVAVMVYMLIKDSHLSSTDTCRNVT